MDNGTAILLASLVPTISAFFSSVWTRHEARKAAKELADKLDDNTRLTTEAALESARTRHEVKDALIKAENGESAGGKE